MCFPWKLILEVEEKINTSAGMISMVLHATFPAPKRKRIYANQIAHNLSEFGRGGILENAILSV